MKKGEKMRPGTFLVGSEKPNAKFKEEDITRVRELLKSGKSRQWVANKYGVHKGTIQNIATGVNWKHV